MNATLTLTPEDREALAAQIAAETYALQMSPVLDGPAAVALTRTKNERALQERWIPRWAKTAQCGVNRYSKAKLLQGLNREAVAGETRKRKSKTARQ